MRDLASVSSLSTEHTDDTASLPTPSRSRAGSDPRLFEESEETAASQVVNALLALGVDTYFGVPGGPVMPLFDAILKAAPEGVKLVESRHETNAAFAAAGY